MANVIVSMWRSDDSTAIRIRYLMILEGSLVTYVNIPLLEK